MQAGGYSYDLTSSLGMSMCQGAALKRQKKKNQIRSSHHGSVVTNPTSIHENAGSIPGLAQWVKDLALL